MELNHTKENAKSTIRGGGKRGVIRKRKRKKNGQRKRKMGK